MTDEDRDAQEKTKSGDDAEPKTSFEEYAGDKKCPECGEPVIDVRATCPNCGYEYKDDDFSDKEAGSEFIAGSAIDDEGNEMPEHESGGGDDAESDDDSDDGTNDGDGS